MQDSRLEPKWQMTASHCYIVWSLGCPGQTQPRDATHLPETSPMPEAPVSPQFLQLHTLTPEQAASEARAGLLRPEAAVSPKFLYDALGSRLFDAITELDEYYPTRTEAAIFDTHRAAIAHAVHQHLPAGLTLVDLGAGNGAKAAGFFASVRPARYLALDISVDFLRSALGALQQQHPQIAMMGVGLDFSARLALPASLLQGPSLVFYPGSSIGNFGPDEALRLLRQVHALCAGGSLLIGVDLVKPASLLVPAYDDALGVTAAFNLNLLRHLNRLIGSDFDPRAWQHVALFDTAASRIEMHLQSRQAQWVRWPGGGRQFVAGERIHTENSYKWLRSDFEALLRDAGFARQQTWTDVDGWFAVVLAHAG
jgi:dimethylhistidine N-methyltransferase